MRKSVTICEVPVESIHGIDTSGWRPFSKEHDPLRRLSDDGKCPGLSDNPHRSRGGLKGGLGRLRKPSALQAYSFGILSSATSGHLGMFELASAPLRASLARGFPAGTAGASGVKSGLLGSMLVPLASLTSVGHWLP